MSKSWASKYYQENKKRPQKKARERYQHLFEEEKEKKGQYGPERYKNFSDEKNKLVEYTKIIIEWEKKGKVIRKSIRKSVRNFWFSGLASSLMKYYKFFKLGARKLYFPKYKKHFKSWSYSIFELRNILLEI